MGQAYQAMLFQAARCTTCKTEEMFFAHWHERDHWVHDDHAGHRVATWLEVK